MVAVVAGVSHQTSPVSVTAFKWICAGVFSGIALQASLIKVVSRGLQTNLEDLSWRKGFPLSDFGK